MKIGSQYQIEASCKGYATTRIADVTLSLGEVKFDFELKEEAVNLGEIVVTAEVNPAINPNRTGAQEIFTKDRMSHMQQPSTDPSQTLPN